MRGNDVSIGLQIRKQAGNNPSLRTIQRSSEKEVYVRDKMTQKCKKEQTRQSTIQLQRTLTPHLR